MRLWNVFKVKIRSNKLDAQYFFIGKLTMKIAAKSISQETLLFCPMLPLPPFYCFALRLLQCDTLIFVGCLRKFWRNKGGVFVGFQWNAKEWNPRTRSLNSHLPKLALSLGIPFLLSPSPFLHPLPPPFQYNSVFKPIILLLCCGLGFAQPSLSSSLQSYPLVDWLLVIGFFSFLWKLVWWENY